LKVRPKAVPTAVGPIVGRVTTVAIGDLAGKDPVKAVAVRLKTNRAATANPAVASVRPLGGEAVLRSGLNP
jgi:hypothetical protein